MRFASDEMLARLARLLRAAGYDASLAEPGMPDGGILAGARAEGRILLTRDRRFAEAAGASGVLVRADSPDGQAAELGRKFRLDWLKASFTRCLLDNATLQPATLAEVERAPAYARASGDPIRTCPACGRIYWAGGHVARLTRRLSRLADLSADAVP